VHKRGSSASIHRQLCMAIASKRLVELTYQGLRRVAEPHDYGMINGVEQLLLYQVGGKSRSKKLPDWRLVHVAEVEQLRVLEEQFPGGRAVPSNRHKTWDRLYARVTSADKS
jgi:hypothetical protein